MLKRIAATDLCKGMYISELCGSWMDHPFWRSRFVLTDEQDIGRIVASGVREVWIDTDRGRDADAACAGPVATRAEADVQVEQRLERADQCPAPALDRVAFGEELERARTICAHSRRAMMSMFNEARMGRAVSRGLAAEVVDSIVQSMQRNATALISLTRLKSADDYTYMHSVAVCGLMTSLSRQLGLTPDQTRQAALGGLMHDIGKAGIPESLLRKPEKLTDEEWGKMRAHPQLGHGLVAEGAYGDTAADVVLHHHERIDGSGYPHGLAGAAISLCARMCSVCDVYDAVTSHRPYKAPWPPAEAIRKLAEWVPHHFDEGIFQAFVKAVGIYPVGSLVRLQSKRLAVVVEHNEKALLKPKVKVFYSIVSQSRLPPEVVDLADRHSTQRIVSREDPRAWALTRIEELWAGDGL